MLGCLDRNGRLGRLLSAFDKAHAVSGYALPGLLYHAEHMGLPAAAAMVDVDKHIARLVERHLGTSTGSPVAPCLAGVRAHGPQEGRRVSYPHGRACRRSLGGGRCSLHRQCGCGPCSLRADGAGGLRGHGWVWALLVPTPGPRWRPLPPGAEAQRPAPPPVGGMPLPAELWPWQLLRRRPRPRTICAGGHPCETTCWCCGSMLGGTTPGTCSGLAPCLACLR
jgi:hypothetical protein